MISYGGDICAYVCVRMYSVEGISMDRIRKHGTASKMLTNDCRINKSAFRVIKFNMYIVSVI